MMSLLLRVELDTGGPRPATSSAKTGKTATTKTEGGEMKTAKTTKTENSGPGTKTTNTSGQGLKSDATKTAKTTATGDGLKTSSNEWSGSTKTTKTEGLPSSKTTKTEGSPSTKTSSTSNRTPSTVTTNPIFRQLSLAFQNQPEAQQSLSHRINPLPALPASKLVFIQYLFALAVCQACRLPEVLGPELGSRVKIKWPNDLYVDMTEDGGEKVLRKVGGVLVNTNFSPGGKVDIVIGMLYLLSSNIFIDRHSL